MNLYLKPAGKLSWPWPIQNQCPPHRSFQTYTLDWDSLTAFDYDNHEIFSYLRLFLGPSIKHLVLSVYNMEFKISTIRSLPRDYPGLTALDIDDADHEPYLDVISNTLCQWNQLESFSWGGDLSHDALIHLAGLTNLRTIDVSVPDLSVAAWQVLLATLQRPGFCAFRRATIACDVPSCTSLLNITSLRQLDSIAVKYYGDQDDVASFKLLSRIVHIGKPLSLLLPSQSLPSRSHR